MKKIIYLILTAFILTSCSQPQQNEKTNPTEENTVSNEEIISNIENYLKENMDSLSDFKIINENYMIALFDQSISIEEPSYKIDVVNVKENIVEESFQDVYIQYRFYGLEVIRLKTIDNGFYFFDSETVNIYTTDSKEMKKIPIDSPSLDMYTTPCIAVSNDGQKIAFTKMNVHDFSDKKVILKDLSKESEEIIWSSEQHPYSSIINLSFNSDGTKIYFAKMADNHDYYGSISLDNLDYEETQLDNLLFYFNHGQVLIGGNENLYTGQPSRKDIISLSENPVAIQADGNNESMRISMNGLGNAFTTTSYVLSADNEFADFTKKLYVDDQLIASYTPEDMNRDSFRYGDTFIEEVDPYRSAVYVIIYSNENESEITTLNY